MTTDTPSREVIGDLPNPLGTAGFCPVARQRSREVLRRSVPLPNPMRLKAANP